MTFRQKLQQRAKKNIATKAIKKFSPYDIIVGALTTEKSYKQKEVSNKYFFRVHKDANKNDVKEAIKVLYNISPKNVNIINVVFKGRTQRKLVRKQYKKAIVSLGVKDKIDL